MSDAVRAARIDLFGRCVIWRERSIRQLGLRLIQSTLVGNNLRDAEVQQYRAILPVTRMFEGLSRDAGQLRVRILDRIKDL